LDKVAIISDIHGNMQALNAVLADIDQQGINTIYCLGDLIGKGPDGDLVVDRCKDICDVIVRGNWDDVIGNKHESVGLNWWKSRLSQEQIAYLKGLPNAYDFVISGKRVRLFHASQISEHHRVYGRSDSNTFEAHNAMFTNTEFTGYDNPEPDIVGYGDIHSAYMMYVDTGKLLFNVGSVGNALDMPLSVYTVLTGHIGESEIAPFHIEFVRVPYDIEGAIQRAKDLNMPETDAYSNELRKCQYRGKNR
jgi:protein phosphatase